VIGRYLTPREAAHVYRDRGWHVVPANGKRPAISWRDGGLTTHEQIDRAWDELPSANVAIVTGPSGLAVFDFDCLDWRQRVEQLEREIAPLPRTLAITGSGFPHFYFAAPSGVEIQTRAPMRLYGVEIEGVDIRAHGGIVIAPGSIHPSTGAAYEWAPHGTTPPDTLPELPAEWIEALTWKPTPKFTVPSIPVEHSPDRTRRYALGALRRACAELASLPAGCRNHRLHDAAVAIGGFVPAVTEREVFDALDAACSAWRDRDVAKDRDSIRRGIEYGKAHPRNVPTRAA
jgi:hypothetical protein